MEEKKEVATLAGGCFWCLEAIYKRVKGVLEVVSGYSGGNIKNPTYEQVCSDTTGHAEAIQIIFNPEIISYDEILRIFWKIHNPTTHNRQGNDVGSQYRSMIFYHNEKQKEIAESSKKYLQDAHIWHDSIVTEIVPFIEFHPAEEYHQDYYENNPHNSYCQFVVGPKIKKFVKECKECLK